MREIKIIRNTVDPVKRKKLTVGDIIEYPDVLAARMVSMRLAVYYDGEGEKEPKDLTYEKEAYSDDIKEKDEITDATPKKKKGK